MKRLYIVTVEFEYAVLAETELEAIEAVDDAAGDTSMEDCARAGIVRFVGSDNAPIIPDGWDDHCLVYGCNGDITLADAIATERSIQNKEKP